MSDRTAHADVSSSTCTASWGWMLFCQVREELWKKVVSMVSHWGEEADDTVQRENES